MRPNDSIPPNLPGQAVPRAAPPRSVLVTGASSGIGLATAEILSRSGMRVFAGVRKATGRSNPAAGYHEIILDVTQACSIAAARREVEGLLEGGGLFAVVNNAGIGDVAPLEFAPLEKFVRIFDVNVFGVVAVTQAFLPLLRKGGGRIVNIGSVGGMVTVPFGSALCASKHAIEAISDALRIELYSSGIFVTCLQPASIASGAAEKLAAQNEETIAALPPDGRSRYGAMLRTFVGHMLASETGGSPPRAVGEAILEILSSPKPPARRLVGKNASLMKILARGIPDSLRDALFRRLFLGNPPFGSAPPPP